MMIISMATATYSRLYHTRSMTLNAVANIITLVKSLLQNQPGNLIRDGEGPV